ncbi:MAG: phosphatidylserine/phosphatidylglycerophosphate/cardiolipin synthase family protein [Hyphomicrobium sp.]|nr:phosphatidylserine/phosphatidylglycerophosphate/cardiolipin synthase family protein [Hyphomicrobium sp.]
MPSLREGRGTFRVFTEGDELYDAMIDSIEGAQRDVGMESYIFAADEVGKRFATALAAKARAGLQVHLHLDAFGSGYPAFASIQRDLELAGVKFKWFHPFRWLRPLEYLQRNHRKLLVVDGQVAFLGGFNIRRLNSRKLSGDRRQRDTHVRVAGPLARVASLLSDQLWNDTTPIHPEAIPETPTGLDALLVPSHSRYCQQRLACLHANLIERSQRYLALTSPYFAPGTLIETALRNAAKRGVEVRLLVPRTGDPLVAGWATRAAYAPLLAAGVQVYEYLSRKLHAKASVVDGEWSVIGSANLDHLSLFVNQELVLIARDRNLAEALRVQHEDDVRDAAQVMPSQWRLRGWRERGLELIGRAARRLL